MPKSGFLRWLICVLACGILGGVAIAQEPEEHAVLARVIDTGAGLASVVRIPGDHYLVYDAGHWNQEELVFQAVQDIVPHGEDIDLLVISHSDSDHLAAVDEIFDAFRVRRVIRTGHERDTKAWKQADAAITNAAATGLTDDINLKHSDLQPGAMFQLGEATITFVSGFHTPPLDWDIKNKSEYRNANSVVIRLEFGGSAILFTGDAVGRHIGDKRDALIATERFMVENADRVPIKSKVLIAPHHGADNASASAFIRAVNPEWVIFSAGHAHKHPRRTAARRYLTNGVPLEHIRRTDLGDDEGRGEWNFGRKKNHTDPAGDDTVDILIMPDGTVVVR